MIIELRVVHGTLMLCIDTEDTDDPVGENEDILSTDEAKEKYRVCRTILEAVEQGYIDWIIDEDGSLAFLPTHLIN